MSVKVATIFPGIQLNQLPSVQASVVLYSDQSGGLEAMVDFDLVTRFKTAGDSFLAASKLARPDCDKVLIEGAGRIVVTALSAYQTMFPHASLDIVVFKSDGGAHLDWMTARFTLACHERQLLG